ncbi:D-alanyl-D-alanine carboxypeptidase family protein [Aureimonas sp. Leaf324]|jgi:D-alanyl-D-alanine carboxypeptidase|uniref:D-alanyl-D-alanine carboxypeptidase family protein n=1 Tax=Aureimonas sp. Leaf324 TaxID=1736336 RepID=UPI0009ECA1F1|nr:D-alanyl-D-alanine carboxypeptidase family protein [Aureimonas sp. Leaf324]
MPLTMSTITAAAKRMSHGLMAATLIGGAVLAIVPAQAQESPDRYSAVVIDANNGKVLFARSADDRRYPASLTKMMTLYMLFDALESGRATLSTPMKVSAYAAARPPSKLGLKIGSTLSVEEGIMGLVTRSANDAAVVIGEFLGGSEGRFAEMMTAKARKLGMSRTTFQNANGLPNDAQMTTARDMATLGIALREHFPQYYKYFSTRSFNFRGQTIGNHNRLLGRVEGVDGIKTGFINKSGFNLVTSVVRGDRKLVAVVMGGRTARSRDDHMADLVKQYLPQTSTRASTALIAAYNPSARGPAVTAHTETVAQAVLPSAVPVPTRRTSNINQRVAEAYGSNATGAMNAITAPERRSVVGRDAIREALEANDRAAPNVATALAAAPVPRASIPNVITQASAATPMPTAGREVVSGWVVQIAATPAEATAYDILSEAKQRAGSALADAQAFTQAVANGSQTLYRARFSGFADKAAANAACDALKSKAYACYAIAAN